MVSAMDEKNKEPVLIEASLSYATVGERIKACIIDGFIIMVIYGLLLYLLKDQLIAIAEDTKTSIMPEDNAMLVAWTATILCLMIDLWYYVIFAQKHHGTFGQLSQNLRMSLRDGTIAGFNAVGLRHVPGFIVMANIFMCGWMFFFLPLQTWMAKIPIYLICITHGYIFFNLFVIAANEKRKSMSDLWAHTAVIHLSSLKEKVEVIFVDVAEPVHEETRHGNKRNTQ